MFRGVEQLVVGIVSHWACGNDVESLLACLMCTCTLPQRGDMHLLTGHYTLRGVF